MSLDQRADCVAALDECKRFLDAAVTRNQRLLLAVETLYEAHRIVVFDTDEDKARQAEILAAAEQFIGYRPGSPEARTDD
jgi:hypothetical protein